MSSGELLIGDPESDHVRLSVLRRSQSEEVDYWDGNWLSAKVFVKAGGFQGGFPLNIRSEEFKPFREGLETLYLELGGTACFKTMEGQLELNFTGDGLGHIQVQGKAVDVAGTGNRLHFQKDVDQTYLPAVIEQLKVLERSFPIVGVR